MSAPPERQKSDKSCGLGLKNRAASIFAVLMISICAEAGRRFGLRGLAIVCLALPAQWACAQTTTLAVNGTIEDPSGAVIVNASMEFSSANCHLTTQTDSAGRFHLEIAAPSGTISAKAQGFLGQQITWDGDLRLDLVLQPQLESGFAHEYVLVTATRVNTAIEDSPVDSVLISHDILVSTSAVAKRIDRVKVSQQTNRASIRSNSTARTGVTGFTV